MPTATELAQREQDVLQAQRRAAPPQEYGLLYKKWEDAGIRHLTDIPESMVNRGVEIESLVVAGNYPEARKAHYDMIRDSFEQLTPLQQKKFLGDCRPKRPTN